MRSLWHFKRDQDGAALIEYSVLIGLLAALVVAVILIVGFWVRDSFTALHDELILIEPAAGPGTCGEGSQGLGDENCTPE